MIQSEENVLKIAKARFSRWHIKKYFHYNNMSFGLKLLYTEAVCSHQQIKFLHHFMHGIPVAPVHEAENQYIAVSTIQIAVLEKYISAINDQQKGFGTYCRM